MFGGNHDKYYGHLAMLTVQTELIRTKPELIKPATVHQVIHQRLS